MQAGKQTPPISVLATELVAIRQEVRLSQDELARIIGGGSLSGRSTIKSIETRGHIPKPDTLKQIADGLATDGSGRLNPVRSEDFYIRLMSAAGYLPSGETPNRSEPSESSPVDLDVSRDQILGMVAEEHHGMIIEAFQVVSTLSPDGQAAFVRAMLLQALGAQAVDKRPS
jgi:transcriptional regulator with XRE-family HTH domain